MEYVPAGTCQVLTAVMNPYWLEIAPFNSCMVYSADPVIGCPSRPIRFTFSSNAFGAFSKPTPVVTRAPSPLAVT